MKSIVKKGDSKTIYHRVSTDDIASFKGETVHEVCSTFVLARELEWSSRQFMFDLCEEDEEGIGTSLSVKHISPAFIGDRLEVLAVVKGFENGELLCDCLVKVGERLIAKGRTGQKVLKKKRIERIFSKLGEDEQEG